MRLDNRGWRERLFELPLIKEWVCSVKQPQVRICHLCLDDYFYTVFLDLSALCLVSVVAKHFLAPSLKISYKILMGLRLFKSWQSDCGFLFTCISLAAQLLRPWPSWCCNTSFDLLFSEFPWSPACEPHALPLDVSVCSCWFCPCSTVDLARFSFHSNICILFIFRFEDCTSITVFIPRAVHTWVAMAIHKLIYSEAEKLSACMDLTCFSSDLPRYLLYGAKIRPICSISFS